MASCATPEQQRSTLVRSLRVTDPARAVLLQTRSSARPGPGRVLGPDLVLTQGSIKQRPRDKGIRIPVPVPPEPLSPHGAGRSITGILKLELLDSEQELKIT